MWISRDLEAVWAGTRALPVRILRGIRQAGKSSLLERLEPERHVVTLDDVVERDLANRDPALFLAQHPPPLTIDEVQYAPPLFPELKRRVDAVRRVRRTGGSDSGTLDVAWVTGSNAILLDREVRESLAGRASYATLHTLSVRELVRAGIVPAAAPTALFLRGGWPELHVDPALDAARYLDHFLLTYVERDIVGAAGIEKRGAFLQVLRLLAARTAQVQNASEVASLSAVQVSTVLGWVDVLERMLVVRRLQPWASNLHKRLTKTGKLYFLDVGLAARLQGWRDLEQLLYGPQAGPLFETLVFGEIVRAADHAGLPIDVHLWRTREGEEIDFVVTAGGRALALDAKLAIQGVSPMPIPPGFAKAFPDVKIVHLVTLGGERRMLSRDCEQVPVAQLHDLLAEAFGSA
jgi:predicted AAA+ superfamily ATPase